MDTYTCTADMLIPGDVILDDRSGPLLILHRETKQIDGRIRFILLSTGGDRFHRTYHAIRVLAIKPLGAARLLQQSDHL